MGMLYPNAVRDHLLQHILPTSPSLHHLAYSCWSHQCRGYALLSTLSWLFQSTTEGGHKSSLVPQLQTTAEVESMVQAPWWLWWLGDSGSDTGQITEDRLYQHFFCNVNLTYSDLCYFWGIKASLSTITTTFRTVSSFYLEN